MTSTLSTSTREPDAIWGASQIAAHVGLPLRRTFYLLQNGLLPAKHVGRQWVASRRKLDNHLAGADAQETV
jgi:hypothetical protein